MQQGQKLKTDDGYQVCLWPASTFSISQVSGPGAFSHCCGHPVDNAEGQGVAIYAPCDCHLEGATSDPSWGNTRTYVSDKRVMTPSGLRKVAFQFTHDNNPLSQTSFKQGEVIYHNGVAGMVTGSHVHIDQNLTGTSEFIASGITCSMGNLCYQLSDSTSPEKVFFANGTTGSAKGGLPFKNYTGGVSGDLNWIIPSTTRPLNRKEMENNAKCFYGYMNKKHGWTLQAVCGVLGNIESESTINPNRWEGDNQGVGPGFGLVQWTPFTNCTSYLDSRNAKLKDYGNFECDLINSDMTSGQYIATGAYPLSGSAFKKSTSSPYDLAITFLANYERPANPVQPQRGNQAIAWFNFLKNWKPELPGGGEASDGGVEVEAKIVFDMDIVGGFITRILKKTIYVRKG